MEQKNLVGSSNYSSYDNNELILYKSNFINSLIYNSKSNDETEATMYFYVKLIIPLKVKMN